ncbi:hypothetical protein G6F22_020543 [Rhizopus arrhizus]|nr:hypothetical protein G6F22_020543 [Rhizopus arrhizus]
MPPGVVHAAQQEGEAAAAVRKAQLQAAGDAFEGAGQDQRQDAQLRFGGHGDQPRQHPFLHAAVGQALLEGHAEVLEALAGGFDVRHRHADVAEAARVAVAIVVDRAVLGLGGAGRRLPVPPRRPARRPGSTG